MKTQYDFIKSLKPGDVITTVGVKNVAEKNLVINHECGNEKWTRYARVVDVTDGPQVRAGDIGVRIEGLFPDCRDVFWRTSYSGDKTPAMARKASEAEHAAYINEYLKCRKQLCEHHMQENKEEAKRLRSEMKDLKKIATSEGIDLSQIKTEG